MLRKKLLSLILSTLLAIVVFDSAVQVCQGQWLSGWVYRKSVLVNPSAGAGTGYPIYVTVHYGTGIDSNYDVYFSSHCQTDFDDIRWTDDDKVTLLSYERESYVASTSGLFWIKVNDDLSTTQQTIYVYYGNSTVTTTSDGVSTFSFYDDFEDNSLDTNKWLAHGAVTEAGGILTVGPNSLDSYVKQNVATYPLYSKPYALRYMCRFDSASATGRYMGWANDDISRFAIGPENTNNQNYETWDGVHYGVTNDNSGITTMAIYDNLWNTNVKYYQNGVLKATHAYPPTVAMGVRMESYYATNYILQCDWVLARKYVSPEPAPTVWGSEESGQITVYWTVGGMGVLIDNLVVTTNGTTVGMGGILTFYALPKNGSYMLLNMTLSNSTDVMVFTENGFQYTAGFGEVLTLWCYFDRVIEPYTFAIFTFNPSNPEPSDTVSFNGSLSVSSGTITSYAWDFGDTNTDAGAFVSHSFSSVGTYLVNLTVTSSVGTDSFTQNVTVGYHLIPFIMASFNWSPSNPTVNQSITFNGTYSNSSSGITDYQWDFGDGNTTAGNYPTIIHHYSANASFPVNLQVTSPVGTASITESITIGWGTNLTLIRPYIIGVFTFSPSNPEPGDTVSFNASLSNSSSPITNYLWDFGDSTNATGLLTSHIYTSEATFTVNLTITSAVGTATLLQNITAGYHLIPFITAAFTFNPTNPQPFTTVSFNASASNSSSPITSFDWNFGDTAISTGITTSHAYNSTGNFTVTLTVTSAVGTSIMRQNITVSFFITAVFVWTPANPPLNTTISFDSALSNSSTPITNWDWNFGDGNTTSGYPTINHTYFVNATFLVTLTVSNTIGAANITLPVVVGWGANHTCPPSTPTPLPIQQGVPVVVSTRLDIQILASTSMQTFWWQSSITLPVKFVNKGLAGADITFKWLVTDASNQQVALGSQTVFISGLDTKVFELQIEKLPEGNYTLLVETRTPVYASSHQTFTVTPYLILGDFVYFMLTILFAVLLLFFAATRIHRK